MLNTSSFKLVVSPFSKKSYATSAAKHQLKKKKVKLRVILTTSVPTLGEAGEELEVSRGFARNFLFPRDYAVYATPETREEFKELSSQINYVERERQKNFQMAQKRLGKLTVVFSRVNENEQCLSPVDATEIAKNLFKSARIDLDPKQFIFEHPNGLNTFGSHDVKVKLGEGENMTIGTLKVLINQRKVGQQSE